jgi:magnesium-transporting ATPase (P-type)
MVAFVGALTRMGTPLAAVQLLWVNLLMDTLAALSLGTEKPHDRLLDRPP